MALLMEAGGWGFLTHIHVHTAPHNPPTAPFLNEHPGTPIMQQGFETVLLEFTVCSTTTFAAASHKVMQLPFTVC